MSRCAAVVLFSAACAAFAAQDADAPAPAPEALAAALQERYDGIRDFSADFVQTYEGGVLRRTVTERGTVLIKKPGMMRWAYTSPEEKLFVSDGLKIYSYVPADRQVVVSSMPSADRATTAVLFLTGRGHLLRDFTAGYARPPEDGDDRYALKLVPRERDRDYEWLIVEVDRRTLQLVGLSALDQQGGTSSFRFSNLKENIGLPDSTFAFQMPRNVDVITDGPVSN